MQDKSLTGSGFSGWKIMLYFLRKSDAVHFKERKRKSGNLYWEINGYHKGISEQYIVSEDKENHV